MPGVIGLRSFLVLTPSLAMTLWLTLFTPAIAQQTADRGSARAESAEFITLSGNVHPLASPVFDRGEIPDDTQLDRMVLVLKSSPTQQAELDQLSLAQQQPDSPGFHHWLTPAEYGKRFGLGDFDLARVSNWLMSQGFRVEEVSASRLLIEFSGTAGQVKDTFHTQLHRYVVPRMASGSLGQSEEHVANVENPQIPESLAGIVSGIVSLHDFRRRTALTSKHSASDAEYTGTGDRFLTPSDFAMLFHQLPAYAHGIEATSVTIAVAARSNISLEDVTLFRIRDRLPEEALRRILAISNSSEVPDDEEVSAQSGELPGAVAPDVSVNLVSASSTATTDGADRAAQYIVNHRSGQVLSIGFDACEQELGATGLAFYNSLWQQAAVEGITVVVAAGGNGAACDERPASDGVTTAVDGLCSSPYATCVGATQHIGGHSPPDESDGTREVSDAPLLSDTQDGHGVIEDEAEWADSGTSATPAAFAGIVASIVHAQGGSGVGNINPMLHRLLDSEGGPIYLASSSENGAFRVREHSPRSSTYNEAAGQGAVDANRFDFEGASIEPAEPPAGKEASRAEAAMSALDPTGIQDSTPALQALFDAASTTVRIPVGIYLVGCTNPLYLSRDNIAYQGAGQGKTVLRSCQGHTVAVTSWSCSPASGSSCTTGRGPFTFTIQTSIPLLQNVDNFYCPQVGSTNFCALETWHGEFPGGTTLMEQFTLNGAGIPAILSTALANPVFYCGPGCSSSPSALTSFTIASAIAPNANAGAGATFSLPQNAIQAYDARSNARQTGSRFSDITFDGGCNVCIASSFDTGLVDLRDPRSSKRLKTANVFNRVTFSNFSGAAVREDLTQGDSFTNIAFVNAGVSGIVGDSPNNLTIQGVTGTNFGWQTDVRVLGPGNNYSGAFNFGCTSGGHTINVQNVSIQPSTHTEFVGFGMWCGRSNAQTATSSAYSNVTISNVTVLSNGNQLLPVSAFADNMTIHDFAIQGPPDPEYISSPYLEVAGSNLNIYNNSSVGVYFAPMDEGTQIDAGVPVHTHYSTINIHDNVINCTAPTKINTGCAGFAIGGFQNAEGQTAMSYIDGVNIYNNTAHYTFGPSSQGHVVHISLGTNEGGNGNPIGQLTHVHVYNEKVLIAGSQSMGGGWSAFATLAGNNKQNANWRFNNDKVQWVSTNTASWLDHIRALPGVVATNVTVQTESTPASPLLTDKSGGTFAGITILQ